MYLEDSLSSLRVRTDSMQYSAGPDGQTIGSRSQLSEARARHAGLPHLERPR
ncbi:MAG: hypothetical protein ACI835_001437 [Planctomycetota bacterium]|jgi:hypothetical protein